MKHKVGDTVRIKSKAWINAQVEGADGFDVRGNDGTPLTFVDDMFIYAGRSFKITSIYANSNYELGDMADWEWSDAMLEDDNDIEQMQKRIERLEAEVLQLKGEEQKPEKIVYDSDKIYVALYHNTPYIMVGCVDDGFVFHTLEGTNNGDSYSKPINSGQACINYHIEERFDVRQLDTGKEALEFMLKYL